MEAAVFCTKKHIRKPETEGVLCHVTHYTTTDLGSETVYYSGLFAEKHPVKYTDPTGRADVGKIVGKAKNAVVNTAKSAGNAISAKAQATFHAISEFHFEGRDDRNTNLPSYAEASKEGSGWTLLSPELSVYHDNKQGSPELKYINQDGREAVFTKDFSTDGSYQLYIDPKYKGTYNYVSPSAAPEAPSSIEDVPKTLRQTGDFLLKGAGHVVTDVLPYTIVGSKNERDQ